MSRLQVSRVSKSFRKRQILDEVSVSIETGEIIGLFGRNGSGKSTFLKCMLGTLKADSIKIKIDGEEIKPSEVIPRQKIVFLPQDTFLPKEMKVRNVIPLIFPKGEDQDKIFYSPGVAGFDAKIVGKLSAGQLKYLELLLLAHMLEPQGIELVKELLLSLKTTKGLLITDHYYRDVLEVTNRSFVLKNAKAFEVENEHDLTAHEYLKMRKE